MLDIPFRTIRFALRFFAVLIASEIVFVLVYVLCQHTLPTADALQLLSAQSILAGILQRLPYVGDLLGMIFSGWDAGHMSERAREIGIYLDIFNSLLLLGIAAAIQWVCKFMKAFIDRLLPAAEDIVEKICDFVCALVILMVSAASSSLILALVDTYFSKTAYIILSAVILAGFLITAIRKRSLLHPIGMLLYGILSTASIYLIALCGSFFMDPVTNAAMSDGHVIFFALTLALAIILFCISFVRILNDIV